MHPEVVQCPQCGSPLQVEADARSTSCSFCDSRLRLVHGASGHPLATLDEIKADTAIIARQTALHHLEGRLADLLPQRQALSEEYEARLGELAWAPSGLARARNPAVLLALGAGLLSAFASLLVVGSLASGALVGAASTTLVCWLPFAVLTAASVYIWGQADVSERQERAAWGQAQQETRAYYDARIAELDEQISAAQARIAELESEMDRLAREL